MDMKSTKFDLRRFLQNQASMPSESIEVLVQAFEVRVFAAGDFLVRQNDPFQDECVLLSGRVVTTILDHKGKEVCVGLYDSPMALSPSISRTNAEKSLVNIEFTSSATIALLHADQLVSLMVENEHIRQWGNMILRAELQMKSEHQWALAALDNKHKLAWFRSRLVGYEDKFDHWRIASYLGMTPVSFSRARRTLG